MKRKWRKRRMMTPRRKAKQVPLMPVRYWETYFDGRLRELWGRMFKRVYLSHKELRFMGYDEAIRHPHYSDPS
jgi:hypothetical protein